MSSVAPRFTEFDILHIRYSAHLLVVMKEREREENIFAATIIFENHLLLLITSILNNAAERSGMHNTPCKRRCSCFSILLATINYFTFFS